MATQRTSIIRGPGSLKYGDVTFYDADATRQTESPTQATDQ